MALAAVCKTLRTSCADAVPTIRDRNAIKTHSFRTIRSSSIPAHAVMPVSTTGADARTAQKRCQGGICWWTNRPLSGSVNDDIWFDVPRERIYIAGIGNKMHPLIFLTVFVYTSPQRARCWRTSWCSRRDVRLAGARKILDAPRG